MYSKTTAEINSIYCHLMSIPKYHRDALFFPDLTVFTKFVYSVSSFYAGLRVGSPWYKEMHA